MLVVNVAVLLWVSHPEDGTGNVSGYWIVAVLVWHAWPSRPARESLTVAQSSISFAVKEIGPVMKLAEPKFRKVPLESGCGGHETVAVLVIEPCGRLLRSHS